MEMGTLITLISGFAVLILILLLASATRTLGISILAGLGVPAANLLIWIYRTLKAAHKDLILSLLTPKALLFDSLKEKLAAQEDEQRQRKRKKST